MRVDFSVPFVILVYYGIGFIILGFYHNSKDLVISGPIIILVSFAFRYYFKKQELKYEKI